MKNLFIINHPNITQRKDVLCLLLEKDLNYKFERIGASIPGNFYLNRNTANEIKKTPKLNAESLKKLGFTIFCKGNEPNDKHYSNYYYYSEIVLYFGNQEITNYTEKFLLFLLERDINILFKIITDSEKLNEDKKRDLIQMIILQLRNAPELVSTVRTGDLLSFLNVHATNTPSIRCTFCNEYF